jgi:hypothetical protein
MVAPKILFVGDTLLWTSNKSDPIRHAEQVWSEHDLIVVNLENPITQNCRPPEVKAAILHSSPSVIKWLQRFRDKVVVSLANNHILDCGLSGLTDTKKHLEEAGIRYCPLDEPLSITLSGLKVSIYSLHIGIDNEFQQSFLSDNNLLKKTFLADEYQIAFCHWGDEYMLLPSPNVVNTSDRLRRLGFRVIVGHHSHSAQGVFLDSEGRLTAYSLGNFNFPDSLWAEDPQWIVARLGYMLSVQLNDDGVSWKRFHYLMNGYGAPFCVTAGCVDSYFNDIDKMLKEYLSVGAAIRQIVYLRHSSRKFVLNNLCYGWFPRIRKGGIRQFLLLLSWSLDYRQIVRYSFMFFPEDRYWKRFARFSKEWAAYLVSAASTIRESLQI